MPSPASDAYRWIPGRGPDAIALDRLRGAFPKPSEPMGEAWFMSETRATFDRFFELRISEIPIGEFGSFLFDLTSGISSFGPLPEWLDWLGYALPDLIERSHESYAFHTLFEPTVSAFLNAFGSSPPTRPHTFMQDVALTLGRCLMKPELWTDPRTPIPRKVLGIRGGSQAVVYWGQTSGDFAAGMFFALHQFPIDALPDFIDSVIAIESSAWRARLVTWLWGAAKILRNPPANIRDLERCNPPIEWENAHCIGPRDGNAKPFLSPERCKIALAEFRKRLEPVLADWKYDDIPELAEVMASLDAAGALFDALY